MFKSNDFELRLGNCADVMQQMNDASIDAIVTDPPYELGFMGKAWDSTGIANDPRMWCEALRVLKPGGHLLAFSGTRTYHRMVCAIEDAGFEIRDQIGWLYGSGFPKSLDVSKAIDKLDAAAERRTRQLRFTEWMRSTGLTSSQIDAATGTNMGGHYLTSAAQPAVATREHLEALRLLIDADVPDWVEALVDERTVESKNFAAREVVGHYEKNSPGNSMRMGMLGAAEDARQAITVAKTLEAVQWQGWGTALKPGWEPVVVARKPTVGTVAANVVEHGTGAMNIDACRVDSRWPANVIHDGSDQVLEAFPLDAGKSPSRFFYSAKASRADRGATNNHPTVKPTELMRYLCRLVTPPGGVVLDPFNGSGSTGKAAALEGFRYLTKSNKFTCQQ
jgi:DNA modification methylase